MKYDYSFLLQKTPLLENGVLAKTRKISLFYGRDGRASSDG